MLPSRLLGPMAQRATVQAARQSFLGSMARYSSALSSSSFSPGVKKDNFAVNSIISRSVGTKPTIEEAQACPREFYEMSNTMIIRLAAEGIYEAIAERLIREVMAVDGVSWDEANEKFEKMIEANKSGMSMQTLPYKVGIFSAVVGGFASFPLCFEINSVTWFNDMFVTTEVPGQEDLETWLEVGSWAWNWMEPPLGQLSFFLLAMQFARAQLDNLGVKPYTGYMKQRRADRLCSQFPQYSKGLVEDFSKAMPFI